MSKRKKKGEDDTSISLKSHQYIVKSKLNLRDPSVLVGIEETVQYISKVKVRGALFFNLLIQHCCKENIDFPDLYNDTTYNQAFLVGIGRKAEMLELVFQEIRKKQSNHSVWSSECNNEH
jgi:hypothetical protein